MSDFDDLDILMGLDEINEPELTLEVLSNKDSRLHFNMANHYSLPKGFVGRNICYGVFFDDIYYGAIVGGSATLHLTPRDKFFGQFNLNNIINNLFYHVEKVNNKYPLRNFTVRVLSLWRQTIIKDWSLKYNDTVMGFETLIELPRTGECYRRDGWVEVGITKGFTCKREAGKGTDSWSGKRVWDTVNLRPKRIFVRNV